MARMLKDRRGGDIVLVYIFLTAWTFLSKIIKIPFAFISYNLAKRDKSFFHHMNVLACADAITD